MVLPFQSRAKFICRGLCHKLLENSDNLDPRVAKTSEGAKPCAPEHPPSLNLFIRIHYLLKCILAGMGLLRLLWFKPNIRWQCLGIIWIFEMQILAVRRGRGC